MFLLMPGRFVYIIFKMEEVLETSIYLCLLGSIATAAYLNSAAFRMKRKKKRVLRRPYNYGRYGEKGRYNNFLAMKRKDSDEFFKYTRMNAAVFNKLLNILDLRENRRNSIPREMKLAITLQYLSQGTTIKEESRGFQIGKTTTCFIVEEVCQAIVRSLMPYYLPHHTKGTWLAAAQGFEEKFNLPHCIGAVEGKSLEVQVPKKTTTPYRTFSLVIMAIVDHNYRFTFADVETHCSDDDEGMFQGTVLGQAILNDKLTDCIDVPADSPIENIEGDVPYFVVGKDTFPLKKNVMKPFVEREKGEVEETFNATLASISRAADNAFGILAARWRTFGGTTIAAPDKIKSSTLACICLHNFIMDNGAENCARYIPEGYVDEEDEAGNVIPGAYREDIVRRGGFRPMPHLGSRNWKKSFNEMRRKLAHYFAGEGRPWRAWYIRREPEAPFDFFLEEGKT